MKRNSIPLLIITIFIVSLACNLPAAGAAKSSTATPVAQAQVPLDPQTVLNQAVKIDPVTNIITVTLTETDLNGIILTGILKLQSSSQITVINPATKLQNGLITVTGQMVSGPLNIDFLISVKPSVTSDHKLAFEVVNSSFGALPVPASVINQLVDQLDTSINQSISSSGDNILIDSITISDGKMVILAHR